MLMPLNDQARHGDPQCAYTRITTSAGPGTLHELSDGRWAVVSHADIIVCGIGATPHAAWQDLEERWTLLRMS